MKPEKRVLDFESNLSENGAERVAMSIDADSLSHVMAVLTDLYSDSEMAVLREYATNARDANTEAGSSAPVSVQTPSALAPFVRISDSGVGLTAADIRDTFSKYGTSTKRESDDVVGMLGLGCKSALTYADSFTVTSTKDGRTISVLVTRDEDGAGSMSIVSDEDTPDAPNGTEIIVPAKTPNGFESKAARLFAYWPSGSVLVNGREPKPVEGLRLSDRILLADDGGYGGEPNVLVMGGVPYPFLEDVDAPKYPGRRIVAFVDIGEVSFTPSREGLQSTKRTREVLARVIAEVQRELERAVRESIDSAKTPSDARRALLEGRALGVKPEAKWNGREILLKFDREPKNPDGSRSWAEARDSLRSFLTHGGGYRPRVTGERRWDIDPMTLEGVEVFEGFSSKSMSPTKRDKLAHWREARGSDAVRMLATDKLSAAEKFWLPDGTQVFDWSEVEAVKLPKIANPDGSTSRPRGSYKVSVDGGYATDTAADAIDTKRPLYWTNGNAWSVENHSAIRYGAVSRSGASIVALPSNRVDKFRRDFPMAVELDEAARLAAADWLSKLSKEIRRAYAFRQYDASRALRTLRPNGFDDSELREAIRLASFDVSPLTDKLRAFGPYVRLPEIPAAELPIEAVRRYPLLDMRADLTKVRDDVKLYCNSKFAEILSAKTADNPSAVDGRDSARKESV